MAHVADHLSLRDPRRSLSTSLTERCRVLNGLISSNPDKLPLVAPAHDIPA